MEQEVTQPDEVKKDFNWFIKGVLGSRYYIFGWRRFIINSNERRLASLAWEESRRVALGQQTLAEGYYWAAKDAE